jgi:Tol biopolymer transport system component/DNA-binding winged helix-turn-helix (wHTH) protein
MLMTPSELYKFGSYSLDMSSRILTRSGEVVTLAPKTFDLLAALVKSNGRLLSKSELMVSLWPDTFVEEANLSFQISALRKALGEDGVEWIETVPKHGYRFTATVNQEQLKQLVGPSPKDNRVALWKKRWYLPAAALPLAITLIGVFLGRTALRPSREPEGSSPAVPLTAYPGYEVGPSLSPDGSQVAFSWNGPTGDNFDIYVKLVGPGRPLRLTTNPAWDDNPAWSPDGRLIAFQRFNSIVSADVFVIPALGGAERKIATMSVRGAAQLFHNWKLPPNLTWTPDAKWIAFGGRISDDETPGIWLVAADGTEKRRLTQVTGHEFGDWAPAFSPDGRNLAFIRERSLSASAVYVLPLSSAFTPAGAPARVTRESAAMQGLAWTPDGSGLVYSSGGHLGLSRMQRITIAAKRGKPADQSQPLSFGERATGVTISKSGRLVYSAQFRDTNLWKLVLDGQNLPGTGPLAASMFDEHTPAYSPDGKRLAFASTRSGAEEIWISDADGSNPMQMTSMGGPQCANPRWSPDGRTILFNSRREGSADLYLLQPDTGELRRITDDPAEEVEPRWSRDGHTIYFGSNRTGRFEVWKMSASGGAAVRITRQGGLTATESPDGRFLYYAKHEGMPTSIWRVPVGGGEETSIVDGLSYALNFVVADRGLYFLAAGDAPNKTSIDFFEYASGKRTTLLNLGKPYWWGMALSPDQKSLLYSVVDSAGSNLMLVDNFR